MSLLPTSTHANPSTLLFVRMFRTTEAEISTLYASTIYAGNTFTSTLAIIGGDFQITNGSSIFDTFVGPSSVTQTLDIDGNTIGQIIISAEDEGIRLIDTAETDYIFANESMKIHNPNVNSNPTAVYGVSSLLLSTAVSFVEIDQNNISMSNVSSLVSQFLGSNSFATSLTVGPDIAAVLTLSSTIVLEDIDETRYSFGSSNFIIHNIGANEPTAFVSPSTIFISTMSSLAQLNDRSLTFAGGENIFNLFASPDENLTTLSYINGGEEVGQINFLSSIGGVTVRDTFGNTSYFASNAFTTANINADNITTRTLTAKTIRVISTIYSESTISTVVLLADSAIISSVIGGGPLGDLQLNSTRFITETGTGIRLNASNGFDVGSPGFIDMNAGGGNFGRISMTANPGILGNFGRVSITANGGQNDLVGLGGLVEITATTPIGTSPPATSAIKFSAAGINSYAGAIPSVGSLAGYNFIYGTAGVNITAGIPSIFPNIPLTTYIYGTAGVVIGSDLYASRIYGYWAGVPYAPSNLLISGRTTVAGDSFVVLSNVSSINGQRWPPPSTVVSTFNTAFVSSLGVSSINNQNYPITSFNTFNVTGLSVSSINGQQYPPNIDTLSTFQNIYVASTIQVASSISFVLNGTSSIGVISGVSSINGLPFPAPLISSFSSLTVSSINDAPYPPPASELISTFATASISSLAASTISTNFIGINSAYVTTEINISSGGILGLYNDAELIFYGASNTGQITGLSSINNVPYPPPASEILSTFNTASISSLAASTISTSFIGMTEAYVTREINISSGGVLGLYDDAELIFYGAGTGQITGLSSINNIPYPPPLVLISTFNTASISSLAASTISTSFIGMTDAFVSKEINISSGGILGLYDDAELIFYGAGTGQITGLSSINNAPYPPPANELISSFATFAVSSLSTAFTSADTVVISDNLFLFSTASMNLQPGAYIDFERIGATDVGYIVGLSSINNLPYPPPAGNAVSTFQTASISSLSVSSINGIVVAPDMFLSSLYIAGTSADSVNDEFDTGLHMATNLSITGGSAHIFFNSAGAETAAQGVLSLRKTAGNNFMDPVGSTIIGLSVTGYSTVLGSTEPIIAKSIFLTGGRGPSDTTRATGITGDSNGNIIFPFSSILGISTINSAPYPPPASETISTFSTFAVSSFTADNITASSLTAERVSTQALYFSSFNDYGFSTLAEWNVAPSGYAVTGSNNKFYMGQSNIIEIIQDVNDRFMLYAGNQSFGFQSTLISSVLNPGTYDSPSTFTSEVVRSIAAAGANFSNANFFTEMRIEQTAGLQDNRLIWATQNINVASNYVIGSGMAFFSTTTGYGAPMVPLDVLSSCAQIMGVTYGSSIGYPDTPPLPFPGFYSFERSMLAASAVEITLNEGGYSPSEIVAELQTQFNALPFPFNQATVTSVNQTLDEYGNLVSQGLQFGTVTSNYPFFSLGFSFLNSGGTNSNWDLNTTTVPILQGAATFLGFPINSQVTWSNYPRTLATGSNTEIGAPIPFGSNMQFNTVDVLALDVSTINGFSFQTIATQNGIGVDYTITEQNNTFLIGYSNIHNIINGYNNRFFITGLSNTSNYQELVVIPPGIYTHPQFVSTVNPLISSVQGSNTTVWPPGDAGNRIALEISSVSSYYTHYQISTVLFADSYGFAFSTWSDQVFDSGTLAIVSTAANLFGMTASTIVGGIAPTPFPNFSETGGRSTIQLTPGTYALQGLADSINASISALGFPYNNISTTAVPSSVSEGSLVFAGSSPDVQGFIGFNETPSYPFAQPPVFLPPSTLEYSASTLGFLKNSEFVLNQETSTTGVPITATPAFFGSNMQFNLVNINELNVSSINGKLAEGIAYQDTAASFSSIAISSIDAGIILTDDMFAFNAQIESLIVSSMTGIGGSTMIQGNLIPSVPYSLGTSTNIWSEAYISSLTVSKEVVGIVSTQQLFASSLNATPAYLPRSAFDDRILVSSLTAGPSTIVSTIITTDTNCYVLCQANLSMMNTTNQDHSVRMNLFIDSFESRSTFTTLTGQSGEYASLSLGFRHAVSTGTHLLRAVVSAEGTPNHVVVDYIDIWGVSNLY